MADINDTTTVTTTPLTANSTTTTNTNISTTIGIVSNNDITSTPISTTTKRTTTPTTTIASIPTTNTTTTRIMTTNVIKKSDDLSDCVVVSKLGDGRGSGVILTTKHNNITNKTNNIGINNISAPLTHTCLNNITSNPTDATDSTIKTNNNNNNNTNIVHEKNGCNKMNEINLSIESCSDPSGCLSLLDILKSFNTHVSEEQAWALIYQSVRLYRDVCQQRFVQQKNRLKDIKIPTTTSQLKVHKDGSVHVDLSINDDAEQEGSCDATSQKKILLNLGIIVFHALDYNLPSNDDCNFSPELENVIQIMTQEDTDDEGIGHDSDDVDDDKIEHTKDLDDILQLCTPRVLPTNPNEHYRAVCRALATESIQLSVFLRKIMEGGDTSEKLRIKANIETSNHELQKLGFSDWARFWMQVVDELRRGIRLKASNYPRAPIEFELTPYEILMEDIRSRKYELKKVMVNGDIPPRVKKDAHTLILEYIRCRPPLKKASERKLPPRKWEPTPREQLLDSIRVGRSLKPIQQPTLKSRLVPSSKVDNAINQMDNHRSNTVTSTTTTTTSTQPSKNKLRVITVDISDDEDEYYGESGTSSLTSDQSSLQSNINSHSNTHNNHHQHYASNNHSQHQNNHHHQMNNENNPNNLNTVVVHRRKKDTINTNDEYHRFCDNALESYDLATQCDSRRTSMRRHTIVGCQSNSVTMECQSTPSSRPESRQSAELSTTATMNPLNPLNPMSSAALDEWTKASNDSIDQIPFKETVTGISDRLALTLEEIVHIRSVMTKAELEGLPVGVRVKEDVERRKVCFLCLRTRFTIFGQWGVQCKLCQRTVCSKCYSKMRIPTEHFRNVPVVLLSPSLMSSPVTSTAPSPSHHIHNNHNHHHNSNHHSTVGTSATASGHIASSGPSSILDDTFPRSLMERLLRTESHAKTRNAINSVPSSPKMQRSTMHTPDVNNVMTMSMNGVTDMMAASTSGASGTVHVSTAGGVSGSGAGDCDSTTSSNRNSIMSRSMEGPRSLPPQSPARPHSNNSTLDRRNRFTRAFTLSSNNGGVMGNGGSGITGNHANGESKDGGGIRGEMMAVCNDCRGLVYEIIRSSKQTRSSARNKALRNLTLDLSPVYKQW